MKIPDLLKIKEVLDLCRFKKTTLYNKIKDDGFPKPKKIGERMARWSKKEVLDWIEKKGFDTSEIRQASKMGDLIKGELYDGTMESLENMVKNLKLEDEVYHFDVITKEFYIHHLGTIYKPGDCYQYLVNEKLYAI